MVVAAAPRYMPLPTRRDATVDEVLGGLDSCDVEAVILGRGSSDPGGPWPSALTHTSTNYPDYVDLGARFTDDAAAVARVVDAVLRPSRVVFGRVDDSSRPSSPLIQDYYVAAPQKARWAQLTGIEVRFDAEPLDLPSAGDTVIAQNEYGGTTAPARSRAYRRWLSPVPERVPDEETPSGDVARMIATTHDPWTRRISARAAWKLLTQEARMESREG